MIAIGEDPKKSISALTETSQIFLSNALVKKLHKKNKLQTIHRVEVSSTRLLGTRLLGTKVLETCMMTQN